MGEVVKKERRLSQRFSYQHPVKYMAMGDPMRPPDEVPREGDVLDLSDGGIRIKTTRPGLGKGLILKVRLPVSKVEASVPVLAEVRWIEEKKTGTFQAGLMFMV